MDANVANIVGGASNLLAARSQMAFTLSFHILLVPFGVCLPLSPLIANGCRS
jgi:cytochrome bd ubiquinol oxidase subunit I